MTLATDHGPEQAAQPNSSEIKVIIVGLGIAGFTAAIECHRKGHFVIALEKSSQITRLGGDCISIGANGARVIRKWANGEVDATLQELRCTADEMDILDDAGNPLTVHELEGYTKGDGYTLNRGALVWHMYQYALSLGIDIRLGTAVDEYWESEERAGVRTATGCCIEGDCILLAEGTHSVGRSTMGQAIKSIETGLAAFRGFISTDTIARDPAARWILEGTENKDIAREWTKDDVYVAMWTICRGKYLLIYCQHKDTSSSVDSWRGGMEDSGRLLEVFQTWPVRHQLEAVIRHIPSGKFLDQKLVIHRPLRSWVSRPHARMMLIGDAAHTILPISGQGGSQAIEDGATVAIALELATKSNVPRGLTVAENIRYPRASTIQKLFSIAVDPVAQKSEANQGNETMPDRRWIFDHDCQRHAYEKFVPIVKSMEEGLQYIPGTFTNCIFTETADHRGP